MYSDYRGHKRNEVTVLVRIAICDDEKEAVTLHEEIIKDSLQSCGIGYEITTYTYSSNLLSDIAEDGFFYDLLLLDIEMPDVTGMELSKRIKPFLPNIKVIFITSHMEYAIDAFELSIFRYVPKNELEKRLKTAVTDAAKLIELEVGKEYIIQTAGRMEKIPYRDIFYIQRDRGCIVNIIQIMKVAGGMAFLKNGEALPVSRSHLQAVKQQINKFWGTHI